MSRCVGELIFKNKRLGLRNGISTMGLSYFRLEGEPPGKHRNCTVKDERE